MTSVPERPTSKARSDHPEVVPGPRLTAVYDYLLALGRRRQQRKAAEAEQHAAEAES